MPVFENVISMWLHRGKREQEAMRTGNTNTNDPPAYRQSLLTWDDTNAKVFAYRSRLESEGKIHGLWNNFSSFQCPVELVEFAGSPAMHLALLLYQQAAVVSYRAREENRNVRFKVTIKNRATASGLSPRSVRSAFKVLERDGLIVRKRRQKGTDGRFLDTYVDMLDPQTGYALQTFPKVYGLLSSNATNDYFHFITVPKAALTAIKCMTHACEKSVYIAALCLASKAGDECVAVDRALWQQVSHVKRAAFSRGLKYCVNRGLVSYRSGVLTVNDPLTGLPTERWKHPREFIHHENPQWEYDLDKVTPDEWRIVIPKAFNGLAPLTDGWHTLKEVGCPFCGERGKFNISYSDTRFRCHACIEGRGRLGKLLKRVLGTDMNSAKTFIQETLSAAALSVV
jgi:hypothetical protein